MDQGYLKILNDFPVKWPFFLRTTFIMVSAGTMLFGSVQSVCVEIVQRRPGFKPPFWHVMVWPFFAVLEGVNCIQKIPFFVRVFIDIRLTLSISWRHLFLELEQKTFLL